MKIRFYIPKGKVIPTKFRLRVDNKYDVYYKEAGPGSDPVKAMFQRVQYGFAYDFTFWGQEAIDDYESILNEIVRLMIWQSEDHDARWVETHREIIHAPRSPLEDLTVRVYFRVRDAG